MSLSGEDVLGRALDRAEIDLYGDSADLYDLVYSEGTANRNKEYSVRKNVEEGSRVLDLACGTGILTEMIDEDYEVTGADISGEMVEIAQNKDLEADFVQADMRDLPFYEEFDAVVMYGQPLSHMETPADVARSINSIHDSLNPDGVFVTDVFSENAGMSNGITPLEMEFGDYTVEMVPEFRNYDFITQTWEGSIDFRIENGDKSGELTDSRTLRGFSMNELEEMLKDAGFSHVKEQEIFGGELHQGVKASKGEEMEVEEVGFFL